MERSSGSSKEYSVRLCTDPSSRTHIMRFPNPGGLDIGGLDNPRLERQIPVGVGVQEDTAPEFGAGSEYGRKQREEARRRRRGMYRKQPSADDFPWLLRSGKKKEKQKFTGRKEGGVQQSASYYLFREVEGDTFEAVPVHSWYNFTQNVSYDTLTAEEAEEQFEKRHKTLNYHAVMMQKRLQGNTEGEGAQVASEGMTSGGRNLKTLMGDSLQVREDEEWAESDSDSGGSGEESKPKPKQLKGKPAHAKSKKKKKKKKKKSEDSDESEQGDEESDDPDVEQSKEVDYMSDGTSDEENTGGYASDEEPQLAKKKEQDDDAEGSDSHSGIDSSDSDDSGNELTTSGRETKKLLSKGHGSDVSDEEDDEDDEEDYDQLASSKISQAKNGDLKPGKPGRDSPTAALTGSRSASPAPGSKAKGFKGKSKTGPGGTSDEPAAKKKKPLPATATSSTSASAGNSSALASGQFKSAKDDVVTEEAVRRYLSRKPMTTKDLLKKFKGKTSMDGEQLVTVLGELLRKINPERTKVRDKTLLSIKA